MATAYSRGLLRLVPRVSPASFLYETATLRPVSLPLHRPFAPRFQRQQSTTKSSVDQDEGADGSSESLGGSEHMDTSSQAQPDTTINKAARPRRSFLRRRAAAVPSPMARQIGPRRLSRNRRTLTAAERKTFGGLLSQLEPNEKAEEIGRESDHVTPGKLSEDRPELFSLLDSARSKAASAKPPAMNARRSGLDEEDNADATEKAEQVLGDLYKVQLSDIGMADSTTSLRPDKSVTIPEAIKMVGRREMQKIETALFQALEVKGEAGVWEVCEERIFSMLQLLEDSESSAPSELVNISPETSNKPTSSEALDIPALLPTPLIIGKLYPQALLLAFRVLSTHFPESAIVDQFRTTIKTQSPASAFLSTSRKLMADMTSFYWVKRQDLPTVISFLRDMHNSAVKPTNPIREILCGIISQHDREVAAYRESAIGFHPFWDLPINMKAYEELVEPGGWMDKLKSPRSMRVSERYGLTFTPV